MAICLFVSTCMNNVNTYGNTKKNRHFGKFDYRIQSVQFCLEKQSAIISISTVETKKAV